MLENSRIDFVKVLLWCCGSATTSLKDSFECFGFKSIPFADKSTGSCSSNEQSCCPLHELRNHMVSGLNHRQMVHQKSRKWVHTTTREP